MNSAEKLKKLRKEKGITMAILSKEIGIGVPAIAKYEDINNPRIPKHEILLKLAKYYNVDIEYLLNEDSENITTENIKINSILGLNDEAIENLAKIKQEYEQAKQISVDTTILKTFNHFIINIDFISLIKKINTLKELYTQNNLIKKIDDLIEDYKYFEISEKIKDIETIRKSKTLKPKKEHSKDFFEEIQSDLMVCNRICIFSGLSILENLYELHSLLDYEKIQEYEYHDYGYLITQLYKFKNDYCTSIKLLKFDISEQIQDYLKILKEEEV